MSKTLSTLKLLGLLFLLTSCFKSKMGVNHDKAQIRVASLDKSPYMSPDKIEDLKPGQVYKIGFYNRHQVPHRFFVVSGQHDPTVVAHLGLQRGIGHNFIPPKETYLLKTKLIAPGKYEELEFKIPMGEEKFHIISTDPKLIGNFRLPLFVQQSEAPLKNSSESI